MLDSIYYSLISLTTIGIGDFVPSVLPPTKFAVDGKKYNNSACFEALINPIPEEGSQNNVTKFPKKCDPVSRVLHKVDFMDFRGSQSQEKNILPNFWA